LQKSDKIEERVKKEKEEEREMMEVTHLLSPEAWAAQTFGGVQLGHVARTCRAVEIATAMAREPAGSLPAQQHSEAGTKAVYRFCENAHVSYEALMQPHVDVTREQSRQVPRVLLIQDTTEVDYQHHPKTTGLGPIGNGTHQGFLLQSVLALDAATQAVLGLAHQEPFLRQPVPKGETARQQQERPRESQVWERAVQSIGTPPPGVQWIHVGDSVSRYV
jgi:Transposase DNA-binding